MFSANEIVFLQDQRTAAWHLASPDLSEVAAKPEYPPEPAAQPMAWDEAWEAEWSKAVLRQHRANFELWHIEDEARRPNASDAELANVKRRVDQTNQRRNDLAEVLDRALLAWLLPRQLPDPAAALHSESPGLMIDRLSILSLKIFHTREEAQRMDAPSGHAERNLARLSILLGQRTELAACLDALWMETTAHRRRFKLYRQLKMYNDPSLNPSMYREKPAS